MHVEEDTFAAAMVEAILEDAGFEVRRFPSAGAALAAATVWDFDVYLVGRGRADEGAPGSLAEQLRQVTPAVPVVVLAAGPALRLRAPFAVLVREPYSAEELRAGLRSALESRPSAARA
jgi:DNA-binding response OmpR family regulator